MYDFGKHCYLLAQGEKQLSKIYKFRDKNYADRCFERAKTLYAIAQFCGFTDRDYEKYLDYKYLVLGE